jgi:hypothetical protein
MHAQAGNRLPGERAASFLPFVIPAKAGTHLMPLPVSQGSQMGPRLRGDDEGYSDKGYCRENVGLRGDDERYCATGNERC